MSYCVTCGYATVCFCDLERVILDEFNAKSCGKRATKTIAGDVK